MTRTGSHIKFYLVFWILILTNVLEMLTADNLPLLSGTLRTFQVHACDGNELRIECFPDTVISINLVHYGRSLSSNNLCPPKSSKVAFSLKNNTSACLAADALKYALLQAVEAVCREQRVCKMKTSPETLGGDPCPGIRKYAEVAYKCRPKVFYNEIACEGQRLRLRCSRPFRIAIYLAAFGGTYFGVPECPQLEGVGNQDCQVSYSTETVLRSCLGKRRCSIAADKDTFGDPNCPRSSSLFLKVVYTCVNKELLRELEPSLEKKKDDYGDDKSISRKNPAMFRLQCPLPEATDSTILFTKSTVNPGVQSDTKSTVNPDVQRDTTSTVNSDVQRNTKSTVNPDIQRDENVEENGFNCTVIEGDKKVVGFLTEWLSAFRFVNENKEKCILYLTVSLGAGLVAFLLVLLVRLYVQKKREHRRTGLNISEPNVSGETVDHFYSSERPDNNVEMVRSRPTLRRQDSDTNPKTPMSRNLDTCEYYS
ncbi:uncharacterized protein LOC143224048 [Tachypleus tridentatus]|uniref:uncharacterized protein LOC143224048 n=1 Tax=Tachypleus tridentatus TaxID=6853 RepID=UPI003FD35E8B